MESAFAVIKAVRKIDALISQGQFSQSLEILRQTFSLTMPAAVSLLVQIATESGIEIPAQFGDIIRREVARKVADRKASQALTAMASMN